MPEFIFLEEVRVVRFGKGAEIIIGMHGWAGAYTDLNVFGEWIDSEKYSLYVIEFPGRGESKKLEGGHTVDDLVRFLKIHINKLEIQNFTLIADSGFSQVAIKYAWLNPEMVKGILFIYTPLILVKPPKIWHHLWVMPTIFLFAKTRKLDGIMNKLRNSDKFMHGIFIDGIVKSKSQEAIRLELLDIQNKRKSDLQAMFESAFSIIKTKVIKEWQELNCKIEVVVAEKDLIISTKKCLKFVKLNPKANITIVKDNVHQWDEEFIGIMRQRLMVLLESK
ncbi:MAG: hypothetical protein WCJ19_04795 [bacterium]